MLNFQIEGEHTFSWPTRSSPPARRCASIIEKYLSDMEEIYDKEVLQENLEIIENMTVKEIRSSLPKGYGFLIYGDSHWAILTNEDLISSSE